MSTQGPNTPQAPAQPHGAEVISMVPRGTKKALEEIFAEILDENKNQVAALKDDESLVIKGFVDIRQVLTEKGIDASKVPDSYISRVAEDHNIYIDAGDEEEVGEVEEANPKPPQQAPNLQEKKSGTRPTLTELRLQIENALGKSWRKVAPAALVTEFEDLSDKIKGLHEKHAGKKGRWPKAERDELETAYSAVQTLVESFLKTRSENEKEAGSTSKKEEGAKERRLRLEPVLSEADKNFLRSKGWTDVDFENHAKAQTPPALLIAEKKRLTEEIAKLESKGDDILGGEKWLLENNLRPNLANIEGILTKRERVFGEGYDEALYANTENNAPTAINDTELLQKEAARISNEIAQLEGKGGTILPGELAHLEQSLRPKLVAIKEGLAGEASIPEKIKKLEDLHQRRNLLGFDLEAATDPKDRDSILQQIENIEREIAELMKNEVVADDLKHWAETQNMFVSRQTPAAPETPPELITMTGLKEGRIQTLLDQYYEHPEDVQRLIEVTIGLSKETGDAKTIAANNGFVTNIREEFDRAGGDQITIDELCRALRQEIERLKEKLEVALIRERIGSSNSASRYELGDINAHQPLPGNPSTAAPTTPEAGDLATIKGIEHVEELLNQNYELKLKNWKALGKYWLTDPFEKVGTEWNKAGLKYKLALSATLIGAALGGGGAIAGAIGSIALTQRLLGVAGTYVGLQAVLNKTKEQRDAKGYEQRFHTKNPKKTAAILTAFLGLTTPTAFANMLVAGEGQLGSYVTNPEARIRLTKFFQGNFVEALFDKNQNAFSSSAVINEAPKVSRPPLATTIQPEPTHGTVQDMRTKIQMEVDLVNEQIPKPEIKSFTDAIDKPGDSVWRSMKEILRKNSEEFGWIEDKKFNKELWLDRRIAEIMQANPDLAEQNLVHEGGVVHLEKHADGSIKAFYDAAPGFESAPKDIPHSTPNTTPHHIPVKDLEATSNEALVYTPQYFSGNEAVGGEVGGTTPSPVRDSLTDPSRVYSAPPQDAITSNPADKVPLSPQKEVATVLTPEEVGEALTQRNKLIDAAFGKPGFLGLFGGIEGIRSPVWIELQKIPASEVLAAPSFEKLNVRYKELLVGITPEDYEKLHTIIREESRYRETIPHSIESPENYLTRSLQEQFIKK